jgi:flavin-dependent dehydrogenase
MMGNSKGLGALQVGGKVVIIGGGPGGTACALKLWRQAKQLGREIEITIVENKQFSGEHHYNQCVGVLSPPLPQLIEEDLGISFPDQLVKRIVKGYILHTANRQITLQADGDDSVAVRRVQYDDYMLDLVKQRGIHVLAARVVDVEFHDDRVVVYTDNKSLEADVVVGAFGLDEGSASIFTRQTGYHIPQTLSAVVTKYHPEAEKMSAFSSYIHAFLPRHSAIEFGGITPKSNHLTINIAGRSVDADLMKAFLAMPTVRAVLPDFPEAESDTFSELHFFKGRFPCSIARSYYGDRYVMVGDAAGLVRAFKGKGVTSAVLTGIRVAETILQVGISRDAFNDHYRVANQDIIQDLPYGQIMRLLVIFMARYNMLDAVIQVARRDASLRAALFSAVSAQAPYRQVFADSLHAATIWSILRALVTSNGSTV